MKKCERCKRMNKETIGEALWAWQPFGPDEQPSYSLLGSHYRGFPVIKICDDCKKETEASFRAGEVLWS